MLKKRILAALLCIALCAVVVFSYAFIARESAHDCHEDVCLICLELHSCQSLLRTVSDSFAAFTFVCLAIYALLHFFAGVQLRFPAISPTALKVKLLN